jgi:hypothetical protein
VPSVWRSSALAAKRIPVLSPHGMMPSGRCLECKCNIKRIFRSQILVRYEIWINISRSFPTDFCHENGEVCTSQQQFSLKSDVSWNVMPCGSCKNQCYGINRRHNHQGDKNRRAKNKARSNYQLKYAANTALFIVIVLKTSNII